MANYLRWRSSWWCARSAFSCFTGRNYHALDEASLPRNRQRLEAAQNHSGTPSQPFWRDPQPEAGHALEECTDRDLAFQASQRRTQAVMHTLTERQVAVVLPGDVQYVGTVELPIIPIRRREHRKYQRTSR